MKTMSKPAARHIRFDIRHFFARFCATLKRAADLKNARKKLKIRYAAIRGGAL
jgi:hypothetical protein